MATKRSQTTIADSVKKLGELKTNQILYILLLVAVFFLGYLFAKVQIQGGNGPSAQLPSQNGQAAPLAPGEKVDVANGHLPVIGNKDAKVTIVEFSDFECPFCGKFYTDTLPQLKKDYIDTGKVKLYYRHFPLTALHPNAVPFALASECANDQGKFWEMHDIIFNNSATVSTATTDTIKQWASQIGLNISTFNSCFDSKKHQDLVDKDTQDGQAVGVSGTPTFYINGQQLVGAQPIENFKAIIDQELK